MLGSIVALSKLKLKLFRFPELYIAFYLLILLVLAKGVGSIILGLALLLSAMILKQEVILKLSILLALTAILYPILCILDLFPHQYLLDLVGSIDVSRAGSLKYRFDQEVSLLERASQRLLFGWGGWDRNRLADSVTDGYWVILVGKYGLTGFAAIFGLMLTSVYRVQAIYSQLTSKNEHKYIVVISITLALLMIDQIPNASINPIIWLLMSTQSGRGQYLADNKKKLNNRTYNQVPQ